MGGQHRLEIHLQPVQYLSWATVNRSLCDICIEHSQPWWSLPISAPKFVPFPVTQAAFLWVSSRSACCDRACLHAWNKWQLYISNLSWAFEWQWSIVEDMPMMCRWCVIEPGRTSGFQKELIDFWAEKKARQGWIMNSATASHRLFDAHLSILVYVSKCKCLHGGVCGTLSCQSGFTHNIIGQALKQIDCCTSLCTSAYGFAGFSWGFLVLIPLEWASVSHFFCAHWWGRQQNKRTYADEAAKRQFGLISFWKSRLNDTLSLSIVFLRKSKQMMC